MAYWTSASSLTRSSAGREMLESTIASTTSPTNPAAAKNGHAFFQLGGASSTRAASTSSFGDPALPDAGFFEDAAPPGTCSGMRRPYRRLVGGPPACSFGHGAKCIDRPGVISARRQRSLRSNRGGAADRDQ